MMRVRSSLNMSSKGGGSVEGRRDPGWDLGLELILGCWEGHNSFLHRKIHPDFPNNLIVIRTQSAGPGVRRRI